MRAIQPADCDIRPPKRFSEKTGHDTRRDAAASRTAPVLLAVGYRCASLLQEAGLHVEACLPGASSVGAVNDCVQDLLTEIDRVQQNDAASRIALYFSQRTTATITEPHRTRVLPVDLRQFAGHWNSHRQSRSLPLHTMPETALLSALRREHLFVSLFRACAESLSSENAARIQSMQTAERNITERLLELRSEFNQSRQTSHQPKNCSMSSAVSKY